MIFVKIWDVIVIGAGVIGTSIALAVRKQGATVLLVERHDPGREASHAAAGMLADCDPHTPLPLQPLAKASAKLYPEFIHELEDESGQPIDFRRQGTLLVSSEVGTIPCPDAREVDAKELHDVEPGLRVQSARCLYLPEASVDPRGLTAALLKAAKHREIELASGSTVTEVRLDGERAVGVCTERTQFAARMVVNCAGAWSGHFGPMKFPTRPIKGQMLAKVMPISYSAEGTPLSSRPLHHVVRSDAVYMVPRSDGRIVIGSTVEDVGFDKRVDPETIHRLEMDATDLLPELAQARRHETWAGLRPGTPDGLPLLGPTGIEGYFVATGHYRDGILLAPVTAHLMAHVISGLEPEMDISAFSPARFA